MPSRDDESRVSFKEVIRNPIKWWTGADLPEEEIRPWESGIQLLAEALKGFMGGFTGIKDRLYIGLGEGKIPPNWKSVHDVTRITWDALNDPAIGAYMDRRRLGERLHRWIMRFNATFSPFFILIQCFHFGLSPLQRLVMWTAFTMFADIMSTANAVSESKIWAGITPHTEQRGKLQTWKGFGKELSDAASAIPTLLMGLQDVIGWSDYEIMIYGAILFTPLTIFCRWLPSYAKQRVDLTVKIKGENETEEQAERPPSLRESFLVVRHNRWWMMNTILGLIRLLLPGTDYMFLYRFLIPKMNFRGKKIGGEVIAVAKSIVLGTPSMLLQPLAVKVVQLFGDKLTFFRVQAAVNVVTTSARLLGGYQTIPRYLFMSLTEFVQDTFARWSSVPRGQMDYEMFDYVEWKTGQRSEGMTIAVDGMLNKLIRSSADFVIGNAVRQWTGYLGWDIPAEKQPPRFINTIWPLLNLSTIIGESIYFIALLRFKYPHNPREVEADLIERRALAQQMTAELFDE